MLQIYSDMWQNSMNIPLFFDPRLTSTRVTWAGWQVSFLEGIIMWSRLNWKVRRTHWGCARWRSSAGKKARASRFQDRSQPAWPSKRTVRLRLFECFVSSRRRSVWLNHSFTLQVIFSIFHFSLKLNCSSLLYLGLWKTYLRRCRANPGAGGEKPAFLTRGWRQGLQFHIVTNFSLTHLNI